MEREKPTGLTNPIVERLRLWQRFHVRLTMVYAVTVLVAIGTMGVLYYRQSLATEMEVLQNKLNANTLAIAEILAPLLESELQDQQVDASTTARLQSHLAAIGKADRDIASFYIFVPTETPGVLRFVVDWTRDDSAAQPGERYDARNSGKMLEAFAGPLVEDHLYEDQWGWSLSGYAPVVDSTGRTIALVGADILAPRIDSIKRRVLWESASVFGLSALILMVIAAFVGANVRRPLSAIIDATNAIASGNLRARSQLLRSDEFGIIGRHFDAMAKGLEEREMIRDALGRYISPDVAARVLADPEGLELGGEEREVTILFSDLRGYSTISERLNPTQVVRLMNLYLGAMQEVLDAHQGVVIEILGDAILAVFNAPNRLPEHPTHAVQCAVAMRDRLHALNREWDESGESKVWKESGAKDLGARIGIHTGSVVAGNLGSTTRIKYAVIGDAVNVAARAEALNKSLDTEILVTADTVARLPEPLAALGTERGAHPVKGRQQAVTVYAF